jgi:hypothetical protein
LSQGKAKVEQIVKQIERNMKDTTAQLKQSENLAKRSDLQGLRYQRKLSKSIETLEQREIALNITKKISQYFSKGAEVVTYKIDVMGDEIEDYKTKWELAKNMQKVRGIFSSVFTSDAYEEIYKMSTDYIDQEFDKELAYMDEGDKYIQDFLNTLDQGYLVDETVLQKVDEIVNKPLLLASSSKVFSQQPIQSQRVFSKIPRD